ASSLTVPQLWGTIIGFTVLYGALAVVEVGLILHTIKKGPFAGHGDSDSEPGSPSGETEPATA
ncbi:MAG: cytochrome ubiquinol oxidase subunit I, partial [Alphaproteobacteria bacterium]|nr:cytochrome ubiquinol oxidase subunit I [Alphaproteobacteria bacterium]